VKRLQIEILGKDKDCILGILKEMTALIQRDVSNDAMEYDTKERYQYYFEDQNESLPVLWDKEEEENG